MPQFQKLVLPDLPPEIVARIMELGDTQSARRLGITSRYFRDVAGRYAYRVRPHTCDEHLKALNSTSELAPHDVRV